MYCYTHLRGDDANSVERNHSLTESIITHNCANRTYTVFGSHDELLDFIEAAPEELKTLHEVITGNSPQKFKLDIDMTRDFINGLGEINNVDRSVVDILSEYASNGNITREDTTAFNVVGSIVEALKKGVRNIFGDIIDTSDLAICTSSSNDQYEEKWSYHIIVDGYKLPNHKYALAFANRLKNYIAPQLRGAVDWGVYKSIQNFRIVGCHKHGSTRTKRQIKTFEYQEPLSTLITYVETCEPFDVGALDGDVTNLNNNAIMAEVVDDEIGDYVTDAVINLVADIAERNGCRFRDRKGNNFNYRRYESAYCDTCGRDHHNENTLHVFIVADADFAGEYRVYAKCRRAEGTPAEYVGSVQTALIADEDDEEEEVAPQRDELKWFDRRLTENIDAVRGGARISSQFDEMPAASKTIYCEPALRPFELKPTLCVDAAMKMGKTKNLRKYLDDNFASPQARIIFLSFRVTFTAKVAEQFADFTSYRNVEGPLNQRRLIVQLESLHRLDMGALRNSPPDLIILDECESIVEQFDSGNYKSLNHCFATFEWLLRESKNVICMDANIGDRTAAVLKSLRPAHAPYLHRNTYANAANDTYNVTANKNKWLGMLFHHLGEGKRICIPCNSKEVATTVYNEVRRRYPQLETKLYTAETSQAEKNEHFGMVDEYWSLFDVVIYTPTVTAGVSFERRHFDYVFAYFTHMSCSVESCIQMLGRVRNVGHSEYYLMFDYHLNSFPTSSDDIVGLLHKNREALFTNNERDNSLLTFSFDRDCNIVYHNSAYVRLWAENRRVINLTRNDIARRMIYMISKFGASFRIITDNGYNETLGEEASAVDYAAEHITGKEEVRARHNEEVATSADISDEDAHEIRDSISAGIDVPIQAMRSLEKHQIKNTYRWSGPVDAEFVSTYSAPALMRQFRNMSFLMRHETDAAAIEQLKDFENSTHVAAADDAAIQPSDIQRRYTYLYHKTVNDLLRVMGFMNGTRSINVVMRAAAANALFDKLKDVAYMVGLICDMVSIKRPHFEKARVRGRGSREAETILIGAANQLIKYMYGCEIKKSKYVDGAICLEQCTDFSFSYEDTARPCCLPPPPQQEEDFEE